MPNPVQHLHSHPGIYYTHVDTTDRHRYEPLALPAVVLPFRIVALNDTIHDRAGRDSDARDGDSRNYVNYSSLGQCDNFHFSYH